MTKGLKQSVCDQSFYIGPVSKFWAYAFVLSKAPELGEYPLSLSLICICVFLNKYPCRKQKKALITVKIPFKSQKNWVSITNMLKLHVLVSRGQFQLGWGSINVKLYMTFLSSRINCSDYTQQGSQEVAAIWSNLFLNYL